MIQFCESSSYESELQELFDMVRGGTYNCDNRMYCRINCHRSQCAYNATLYIKNAKQLFKTSSVCPACANDLELTGFTLVTSDPITKAQVEHPTYMFIPISLKCEKEIICRIVYEKLVGLYEQFIHPLPRTQSFSSMSDSEDEKLFKQLEAEMPSGVSLNISKVELGEYNELSEVPPEFVTSNSLEPVPFANPTIVPEEPFLEEPETATPKKLRIFMD